MKAVQSSDRSRLVLGGLLLAHLLLKLSLLPRAARSPISGDEILYVAGGQTLANVVRDLLVLRAPDLAEVNANVVAEGWFMPGTALLLTPLYLVFPDAGLTATRLWMGAITLALLVLAALAVRRTLGDLAAGVLLVLPGLVPVWVLFSYTTWGDVSAGLVVVLVTCAGVDLAKSLRAGEPPGPAAAARFGLLLAACLYLRSSALPLVAGLLVLLLVAGAFMARRARWRSLVPALVAGCVVAGLVAPWSITASRALDGRVITTTTVPLSLAVSFGDHERLCFGPCYHPSVWFGSVDYARDVAAVTGAGPLAVQREMSDYALADVTVHSYAEDVLANAGRYLFQPSRFAPRFAAGDQRPPPWLSGVTDFLYGGIIVGLLAGLLVVARRAFEVQLISLLVKLVTAALLVQPFVHVSTGRYWPILAPLSALAIGLAVRVVRPRADDPRDGSRLLTWLQMGVIAAFVAVGVGLVALAR